MSISGLPPVATSYVVDPSVSSRMGAQGSPMGQTAQSDPSVNSDNSAKSFNSTATDKAGTSNKSAASKQAAKSGQARQLTPEQQRQVDKLVTIDRSVREHEAAHLRAGGNLVTSGPNYSYTYGPDGKRYVTGGEVGIDAGATGDPQTDINKGLRVEAAALAPADPSPQDLSVAAAARQMVANGRAELAAQGQQEAVSSAYSAYSVYGAGDAAKARIQPGANIDVRA